MIRLSKKQCAIINAAVKPFELTSRYIGSRVQKILEYHSKYFIQRRHTIICSAPVHNNNNHFLTLLYNKKLSQKGGFIKKLERSTWNFYGISLQTKYGKKQHRKLQKESNKNQKSEISKSAKVEENLNNKSNVIQTKNDHDHDLLPNTDFTKAIDELGTSNERCLAHDENNDVAISNSEKIESSENLFNLDLHQVATLITDAENENCVSDKANLPKCMYIYYIAIVNIL